MTKRGTESRAKLIDDVKNVEDFNKEQLKQCARGVINEILTGRMGRTKSQLAMTLLLNEAHRRHDLEAAKKGGK